MQHFSLFWLRLSFRKHCHFQTAAEVHATSLNERGCSRSQKKRRQQSRRGNTVSEKPTGFSGKKPPCPTKSGSAAKTEKIESFVYCPLNLVRALQFCSACFSDLFIYVDLATAVCLTTWRTPINRCEVLASYFCFLLIPSSAHRRSGIRSRVSRRSYVLFSDRSSRSSTGKDFLPAGTSDRDRSVVRGD
jgi:hypothetical protein